MFLLKIAEPAAVLFTFKGSVFERGKDDSTGFQGSDHAMEYIRQMALQSVLESFPRLFERSIAASETAMISPSDTT